MRFGNYFVYGMHWMLNIVTGPIGYPAVLIRGVDGFVSPGRLTKAIGITGRLNAKVASEETGVWFSEAPIPIKPEGKPFPSDWSELCRSNLVC